LAGKNLGAPKTKLLVQVAAFKSDEKAQQIRKEVQALGLASSVARVGSMARVRVGPYRNPVDAEKAAAKLKLHGFNALIMQY
ncbi:MAG: SPOR domain-containing protein, partial [Vitreoscilla sp.]|nr:SPOR domain-containing protein [Vitreoscilla sp.]